MNSDTDLPHQEDTLQQQPPRSFKPLIWKVIFIPLIIINLMFFVIFVYYTSTYPGPIILVLFPVLLVISIIDFIAVLSYIIKKHPHSPRGITRVIADAALIAIILVLILAAIFIYGFRPR